MRVYYAGFRPRDAHHFKTYWSACLASYFEAVSRDRQQLDTVRDVHTYRTSKPKPKKGKR